MAISYSYSELQEGQKSVTVRFVNDEGLEVSKVVNIPYNSDGSLNESYFQEILDGQLRSVEYKVSIGSLEFGEPEPESNYVPPEV